MKPKDLKCPFDRKNRHVTIDDRIWYVPGHFYDFGSFSFPGWHHSLTFPEKKPICLEFCSGNGTWIAEKALEYPEYNWVGVEKNFVRARKIWSKIKNCSISNLLAVCGEGYTLTREYLPSSSVKEVYINFPDPWPKTRHCKHRLIQIPFVKEMERILISGGEVTFVTDDPGYSEFAIDVFGQVPGFRSVFESPFYADEYPDYGTSFFEDLWRDLGRKIRYHVFRKVSLDPLEQGKSDERIS